MREIIPLDLLHAVRSKKLRFRAWASDSFRATLLRLKNESHNELRVDVSRSGLTAMTGMSQTIGLAYPAESSPGDRILVLKSGEEREVVFVSRCLNVREKRPENGTEYKLVPELLANYVAELLRQGVDQDVVWAAIADREDVIIVRSAIPAMVDKF